MGAISRLYSVVFRLPHFIPLTRSQRKPLQRIVSVRLPAQCHSPRQPQLTARAFEQPACSSQSLLCLVTLGASIQPWQPGPQTTMLVCFFNRFMRQRTHKYIDNTKQYSPRLSPQTRSSQVLNSVSSHLSQRPHLVLQFHLSCHLHDFTVY